MQGSDLRTTLIAPERGRRSYVIPVWVSLPADAEVPLVLHQRARLVGGGRSLSVYGKAHVNPEPATVIGAPLRGSGWVSVESVQKLTCHHRRGIFTFNGHSRISQRYAIDWIKLGADGNLFRTDGSTNEDYYGYGEDILAVADGVVADMKDGQPENVPNGELAIPTTLLTAGGNYVFLKIAEGTYAFYAHMIPGSITVRIGDRVSAGQVIGKFGNSGNSTGPHLHFEVNDGPGMFTNEGLPYVFRSFVDLGTADVDQDPPWTPDPSQAKQRLAEMPREMAVVEFPAE